MFGRSTKNRDAKAGSSKKHVLIPSVVSSDMHVIGNIVSPEGVLDIDGQVHGNVRAHTISLRENGKVNGDLVAEQVYIYGTVEGLVKARQVTLYATARVTGSIMHETLSVEDGAFVDGKFKRTDRMSDEELFNKKVSEVESLFDNDNSEAPSEAELLVLENLRLIR
ncbi:MAG: polymer-forming cytoskeletal protein [Azospirillum brasilense]|nr:MAG: polymer-forming cytoskeletal protein [Azospirillum brasilense]